MLKYRTLLLDEESINWEPEYAPGKDDYSFGEQLDAVFSARDAALVRAEFNALKLLGLAGEVVEVELDEGETPPAEGQFQVMSDTDDPVYRIYKDGVLLGVTYYSFRGSYQGSLWVKSTDKNYWTNDAVHPDGAWDETDSDLAKKLAEGF